MAHDYIVGYDASAPSRAAPDFTRDLGRRTGVPVIAAHVYPSPDGLIAAPIGGPARFAGGAAGESGTDGDSPDLIVYAVVRAHGADWTRPVNVNEPDQIPAKPRAAVDPHGNTIVVWKGRMGILQAATRDAQAPLSGGRPRVWQ